MMKIQKKRWQAQSPFTEDATRNTTIMSHSWDRMIILKDLEHSIGKLVCLAEPIQDGATIDWRRKRLADARS